MRKLLAICVAVALLAPLAQAQENPLAFEIRGTVAKGYDRPVNFTPSIGLIYDFGSPIAIGLTYAGEGIDSSEVLELFLPLTIQTWQWGAGGNERSFALQTYIGTDVTRGTNTRTFALGGVYDHGLLDNVAVFARGAWRNWDAGGTSLTDWSVQFGALVNAGFLGD